jgi:colanic acid biosynthesis protein WcaH
MSSTIAKLNDDEFAQLIRIAPLVSIDIICVDADYRVLLLKRKDKPAKNCYFVPGGRILKNEAIGEAFERILNSETGLNEKFEAAQLVGANDHMHKTNRYGHNGYGTHYVVLAYEIRFPEKQRMKVDEHHSSYIWVSPEKLVRMVDVHKYVKQYFIKPGSTARCVLLNRR